MNKMDKHPWPWELKTGVEAEKINKLNKLIIRFRW